MNRLSLIAGHLNTSNKSNRSAVCTSATAGVCPYAKPTVVTITGAAGNIGYSLAFFVAQGYMLGNRRVDLRLLDIPPMANVLNGVKMELLDGAFPLIKSITTTTDNREAFEGVDIALMVGAKPRGKGMLRGDLLRDNAGIFAGQGKALEKYASRSCKIVVVGNPANTNCLILMKNAPSLPPSCFSALTWLDQNRAKSQLASRLQVNAGQIKNLIIWGNHSSTQYPDVNHAFVSDYPGPGQATPVRAAVKDDAYLNGPFVKTVQQRGSAVIKARGKSSAASAANAVANHINAWVNGSNGEIVSMAVPSDGSYGIAHGLVFSFPVICIDGGYKIVQGLPIDQLSSEKLKTTEAELLSEREQAFAAVGIKA